MQYTQRYNDQYAATGGDNPQLPRRHVDLIYSWIGPTTIITYGTKCEAKRIEQFLITAKTVMCDKVKYFSRNP